MGNALKRMVFQPPSQPTYECDARYIWLATRRQQRIPAFFIDRGASITVIFSHGNAEDIGMVIEYFTEVATLWNCNFFIYEYVGYGRSSGRPSEQGVYDSIEAAYDYLTKQLGLPSTSLVAYGRSLGTGASCHLASRHRLAGMILQSGLTSIHRVGLNTRFSLPGDMFCNIDKITKVDCPVFVIHGTKDEIVPVHHGMELYNKCRTSVTPYWVEGGGHNNLELLGRRSFYENVARFLKFVRSRTPPPEETRSQSRTPFLSSVSTGAA
ncbi:putative alpha/beta hydrolase [Besnoitia besnoiti]|uniref:Putative alpha/beta hydrolase n=1 Tax=Besnoitia besnoiti TaxID=94643 RepID=A0A2A9MPR0_BESBE|nr:putative alpha/beta hydrolase [Besnoitia besnoiti]PFH37832.1 putative alpha/beta hydrolase [Besnoitia besnoiti]